MDFVDVVDHVYIIGKARIKVISGSLLAFGKLFDMSSPEFFILSSPSTYVIPLFAASENCNISISSIFNGLQTFDTLTHKSGYSFTIMKELSQNFLKLQIPSEWNIFNDHIKQFCTERSFCPSIFISGTRKVGKSTFMRYCINTLLNSFPNVAVLDLDCGQTEFAPPGFLSLKIVRDPLLGPPYSHNHQILHSCFIGSVSVEKEPSIYLKSAKQLFSIYQTHYRDFPLVINNMGWMTGLGGFLVTEIYKTISPNILVSIIESIEQRNPLDLTIMDSNNTEVKKIIFTAVSNFKQQVVNPKQLRLRFIECYFGASDYIDSSTQYKPLLEKNVMRIRFSEIKMLLLSTKIDINTFLSTIQLNIAGMTYEDAKSTSCKALKNLKLSYIDPNTNIPNCFAACIFKTCNLEKQTIDILAPIHIEDFSTISFVLNPGFAVPSYLFAHWNNNFISSHTNFSETVTHSLPRSRKIRNDIKRLNQ